MSDIIELSELDFNDNFGGGNDDWNKKSSIMCFRKNARIVL